MFLVKDGSRKARRDQIRKFAAMDGCVGFLMAMIDFEWTFKRVVMVLGKSSLADLRKRFEKNMPFPSLPKRWDEEVDADYGKGLGIVEEYIDLRPVLRCLMISPQRFLKPIKNVEIAYA